MSLHCEQTTPGSPNRYPIWFLAALGILAAAGTIPYLDQGWLPLDEGIYGWYAERMADGAVLRRDLLVSQPGYVAYLNALTWQWFGHDLLALRYPMLVLTAAMTICGALLLPARDPLSALAVALIMIGLGFSQLTVPSPSWYCLTLALVFACLIASAEDRPGRWLLAGLAAGVCVGTRQLSGGLLVISGLCVLAQLGSTPPLRTSDRISRWLGLAAIGGTGAAVPAYLYFTHSIAAVYWGLPALAVLSAVATSLMRKRNGFQSAPTNWFMAGCAGGFAPLLIVNATNDELGSFLYQTTVGASGYVAYGNARNQSFGLMFQDALELLTLQPDIRSVASGVLLLMLLGTPLALLWTLWKSRREAKSLDPVLICASLFSVSSTYFQSYLYLFYALPLTVVALIRFWSKRQVFQQRILVGLTASVALFTLVAFGGNVSGEVLGQLYRGTQRDQVDCNLPRCPLEVAPAMRNQIISELADLRRLPADRPLLILPNGAPHYLMLPNPTPWRWAALNPAAASDAEQTRLLEQLKTYPEVVVAIPHEPVPDRPIPPRLRDALCPSDLPDGSIFGFHQPCDAIAKTGRTLSSPGPRNSQLK